MENTMTIQPHGHLSTNLLNLSNTIYSVPAMSWQKKKGSVDISIAPSMQTVYSQSTLTSVKLTKSTTQSWTMIGKVLEYLLPTTGYDTAHCPHRCLQKAVPLCQMRPMESNLLEHTCPLKNQRKDLLSKWFLSSLPWRTTTHCFGRWKITQVTLM